MAIFLDDKLHIRGRPVSDRGAREDSCAGWGVG